ncbi:TPA: hypothetical protein ACLASW_001077, partial [Neisseria meningitidis]
KKQQPAAVIPAKAGIQSLDLKIIFNSSFPQKRESGREKPQEFVGKNRNLSVHPKCFRRGILGRIKNRSDIFFIVFNKFPLSK